MWSALKSPFLRAHPVDMPGEGVGNNKTWNEAYSRIKYFDRWRHKWRHTKRGLRPSSLFVCIFHTRCSLQSPSWFYNDPNQDNTIRAFCNYELTHKKINQYIYNTANQTPPPDHFWQIPNQTDPILCYESSYSMVPIGPNQLLFKFTWIRFWTSDWYQRNKDWTLNRKRRKMKERESGNKPDYGPNRCQNQWQNGNTQVVKLK